MTARTRAVTVFPLALCLFLSGCGRWSPSSTPSIAFSTVPAAIEDPDQLDTIEGWARGARSGQQIVLYAQSEGRWRVQPFPTDPFTRVQSDSRWKNKTHLGTEYGALLVDPGYHPPPSTDALPPTGGGVEAVVVAKGPDTPPGSPKILHFSGYDWTVRTAPSHRGGARNSFDPANAWTDDAGALHLRIAKHRDQWSCAEVQLTRSLGYGTYTFVVRDTSRLEPSAVLTLFTWDGLGPEENRRELAYEISRWGNPKDNDNTAFVVQPYYVPTNVVRFRVPAGVHTYSFRWEATRAIFTSYAGSLVGRRIPPMKEYVFSSGIPPAGGDAARMNLYIFRKGEAPLQHENEIVIEKFEYYP